MATLSVSIDDITLVDEASAIINFRWTALDSAGGRSANDSGSMVVRYDDATSSVVNQRVIDECVRAAGTRGVVVGQASRKLLLAGLV